MKLSNSITLPARLGFGWLILVLLTACAWAPGPTLTLRSATIVGIEYTENSGVREIEPESVDQQTRAALKLEIVADDNLYTYFKRHGRYPLARCFVERDKDDRSYQDRAIGPLQDGINLAWGHEKEDDIVLSLESPNGEYPYSIYAFSRLTADHEDDRPSNPVSPIDLRTARFNKLSCSVLGWTLLPEIFFMWTSEVVVVEDSFREMLKTYDAVKGSHAGTQQARSALAVTR